MNNLNTPQKLLRTKGFLGHKIGKNLGILGLHPTMLKYIVGKRNNLSIIGFQFTFKAIIKSFYILASIIKRKGRILIVNTNPELTSFLQTFAKQTPHFDTYFSYCNSKWVGGTLTNWNQVSKSITTFISLFNRFDKYITRNKIHFPKYRIWKKSFQGFTFSDQKGSTQIEKRKFIIDKKRGMQIPLERDQKKGPIKRKVYLQKPDIVLVLNPNENKDVLCEAKQLNIPVIALTDTNTDLSYITYPIPVNVDSLFFSQYYFSWISRLIRSNNSNNVGHRR